MWDPQQYLRYADERGRPFFDLVGRIGADAPRRVVDLGCGPGQLTSRLRRRWPDARVEGVDSSPEMVAAARAAGVDARVADVREWTPADDVDVVVCNAVLQWVPGHAELLRGWVRRMTSGGWLALQVPGNFDTPSHALVRELAASPEWSGRLDGVRHVDAVDDPQGYAELLAACGCSVDAWETTYLHQLSGEDAVLEWMTGTGLRPIRAALDDAAWEAFRAELAPRLQTVYPVRDDGTVWFPFRRIFAVAQVS